MENSLGPEINLCDVLRERELAAHDACSLNSERELQACID
jgi:hypothetical protein